MRKAADISTLAHESAHIWRRTLHPEDLAVLEKHYGVEDGSWHPEAEEKFARHFERYLRDGKAPNASLKQIFAQFRGWLTDIYGRFEQSLKSVSREKVVTPQQRQGMARLWEARAKAWASEAPGRTVEQFYREHAPELRFGAAGEHLPEGALPQYEQMKRGQDPRRLSQEDLEPYNPSHNGLVRVAATMADLALHGFYFNPKTGASVRLYGGPEFGLGPEHYGDWSWANQPSVATLLQKAAAARDGLVVVYSGHPDAVLSSAHSALVARAEIEAAIRNGTATEKQILNYIRQIVDARHHTTWKNLADKHPLPETTADLYRLMDRDNMAMPRRHELIKDIFSDRQPVFPHWETMRNLMISPAVRGAKPGDVMAALHVDSQGVIGRGSALASLSHPAYGALLPGINLGLTSGTNIRDLFVEQYLAMKDKLERRIILRGLDPSALSDGTIYSRFKFALERQRGHSFEGITNGERLRRLGNN